MAAPPRIYTRTGDNGTTGLSVGDRVYKDNLRIQALGEVDELNCQIGVVCSLTLDNQMKKLLQDIQNLLFELGAELAQPTSSRLIRAHTTQVEQSIDRLNESLPPLNSFILPGGTPPAAHCHLARAACRQAERCLFRLSRTEHVNPVSLQFMNRLSDLLFLVARTMNHRAGTADLPWRPLAQESKT